MTIFLIVMGQLAGCARKTISIDVGGESIAVPVPGGFLALENRSSSFRSFVKNGMPQSAMLLEYFMTKRSMRDVENNDFKDLMNDKKSMVLFITMPKSMYGHEFSEENFLGYASATRETSSKRISQGESLANNREEIRAMRAGSIPSLLKDTR